MHYQHISVTTEQDGAYATVTMNRPARRNALSMAHMQELTHAFRAIGQDDAVGITLAGNGPVFCSGRSEERRVGKECA